MKVHHKAALYDSLIKDYEQLIMEMEKIKQDIEDIPNRPDVLIEKETDYSHYLAVKCGSYSAMAFAIDIKLSQFKGMLKWYMNQK